VSAVIVAILLLVLGALMAWQAVLVQTGRQPYGVDASAVADRLHRTPWTDTAVITAAAVAIVVGLGLLALAMLPSRRRYLQLRESDPVLVTGITPANLRRALSGAAQRVNGINAAETELHRTTATTVITSSLSMTERLPAAAEDAITVRLKQLDPVVPIAVRVRLSSKGRR
jgi:ABC-type Fe3+ transport system permease subunit